MNNEGKDLDTNVKLDINMEMDVERGPQHLGGYVTSFLPYVALVNNEDVESLSATSSTSSSSASWVFNAVASCVRDLRRDMPPK
ncbi:hypothetical protein KPH14_006192 [Odynerus spinipes]|uniref:Uncharacterized protein n=1 Tax=Odynerus spinipes TaxID=1348599 RepID=A0AAD9RIR2_9HYME|nr:hypothetical protein KPH14_006192 [Odynerus spinipes]